jgi:lipopolysaccharide export system protein LptA
MKLKYFLLLISFLLPFALNAQEQKEERLSALLGGMTQSDRWIIRKDKLEEEFIGNVRYENDMYKIQADRALSKRKEQSYLLEGNVYASRKDAQTKAEITARKIIYNRLSDAGTAESPKNGQISLRYIVPGNDFKMYGDKLSFSGKFTRFVLSGDAELNDKDNTLYAGEMAFNTATGVFEAYKQRPVFWGFNNEGDYAAQADKITVLTKERKVRAEGKVRGWITPARDFKDLKGSGNGTEIR